MIIKIMNPTCVCILVTRAGRRQRNHIKDPTLAGALGPTANRRPDNSKAQNCGKLDVVGAVTDDPKVKDGDAAKMTI